MPNWAQIDFIDGDFVLIKTPAIAYSDLVRHYHLALLSQLEGFNIYPFDHVLELQIYETLKLYYQKIANQLPLYGNHQESENFKRISTTWVINCDRVTSKCRHEFFVCTEPVHHPTTQELIVGLSRLSQLMGYTYDAGKHTAPKHTTGSSELDIWVDTLLVFKGRAKELLQEFGTQDLANMLVQANHRLTPPDKEDENKEHINIPLASIGGNAPDHPLFVENRERITQGLYAIGIELPEGW
jgi:hypothetical protein